MYMSPRKNFPVLIDIVLADGPAWAGLNAESSQLSFSLNWGNRVDASIRNW